MTLTEFAGDLRAGLIRSRAADVVLTSLHGSIVDAPEGADATASTGDATADVVGINITLTAAGRRDRQHVRTSSRSTRRTATAPSRTGC